jgi:hypothetical protein
MPDISSEAFERSRRLQIEINRQRTPTQRFEALCALLDVAIEMAPKGEVAAERRRRALAARQQERERWREQHRRFLSAHRDDAATGL